MSPFAENRTLKREPRRPPLHTGALIASLTGLASCGGYHDHGCRDCAPFTPAEVSVGLVAGNFANNGQTSLVATSTVQYGQINPGSLKTYLATGPGAFAVPALITDGNDPLFLASADLNGDKLSDVVSASYSDGSLAVFFNNVQKPGTFSAPLILTSPGATQVAIGDLNGDGLPDLVSADFNVSLFVQISPGAFSNPISLYAGGANWVAVGDLNGDGAQDVALTDNTGVKVLMHTGSPSATTFAAPVTVFTQTVNGDVVGANVIAIADVNGDGYNDLMITDPGPTGGTAPTVSVLLQDAAHPGRFMPAVSYPTAAGSLAQSIVVTDVDGDGHPDIVIGGTGAVTVLLNAPTPGTFMAAANYLVSNANQIVVADVNGDGRPDIIVAMGPSQALEDGVITHQPGVLLQSSSSPGAFGSLQDLP